MTNKSINFSNRYLIIAISAGHFIHDVYTSFLSPVLPILIDKLQLTYTMAGALGVFFRLPQLLNPIVGLLSDRIRMKYLVITAPSISGIAMTLLGNVNQYYGLVVLLLIAGFGAVLYHVPAPVLINRMSGKRSGFGMSIFMIGGEGARTLGPIILMGFISIYTIDKVYFLIPFGIVASLILFALLKNIEATPVKHSNNLFNKEVLISLLQMKHIFFGTFGTIICKSFTASVLATFLPVYLKQKGFTIFWAGSSLSIVAAAAIVGVSISGPLSDTFGRKNILLLASILSPFAMLIFLIVDKWFIIPSLILLGILSFSTTPVIMALIQDGGKKIPALANSIYMIFNFLFTSIAVLFVGKMFDLFGITISLYLCIIISLSGIPFVIMLPKEGKLND